MSVKKMTVIPTHLYEKLIKHETDYDDQLKQQKDEILSWKLPPELTSRFYQDVVRNIALRRADEDAKPLLVSTKDSILKDETEKDKNPVTEPLAKKSKKTKGVKTSLRKSRKAALINNQVLFSTPPQSPETITLSDSEDEVFRTKKSLKRLSGKRKSILSKWKNLPSPPKTRSKTKKQEGAGRNKMKGWIEFV
jgi:hypothetical protein